MLRDLKHHSLRIGRFERTGTERNDGTSGTLELASFLE
jgi:hypothetical protein